LISDLDVTGNHQKCIQYRKESLLGFTRTIKTEIGIHKSHNTIHKTDVFGQGKTGNTFQACFNMFYSVLLFAVLSHGC